MLKKEIKYRLCRLLIANLQGDEFLSSNDVIKVNELLLDRIDTPFRSVENMYNSIGDGVKVNER